jgi:hypothetical protein
MKTISFDSVLGHSAFEVGEPDVDGWQLVTVADGGPRVGELRRAEGDRPFEYRIYGPDTWPMAQAKPLLLHQVMATILSEEALPEAETLDT